MKKLLISILAFAIMCPSAFAGMIQVKGSDTELNAVQALAEAFMAKNDSASVAVTGGGSGAGIAALINKKADIAISSRQMTPAEVVKCRAGGVDPNFTVFGIDGLSVIVNGKNTVKALTMDQIAKIYKGEIKNWKDVGGADMAISLYGRQSSSGTFVYFRTNVLKGEYSSKMNRMSGNAQIVEGVKADKGAIGYVGVGYTQQDGKVSSGISVLSVAAKDGADAISPLVEEDVLSGKYPIARPLYHYFNGKPSGDVLSFLQYEISDEGQKIMSSQGFYAITPEYQKLNASNLK